MPLPLSHKSAITNPKNGERKTACKQVDDQRPNDLQILHGTQLPSRDRKNQSKAILAKGAELNQP